MVISILLVQTDNDSTMNYEKGSQSHVFIEFRKSRMMMMRNKKVRRILNFERKLKSKMDHRFAGQDRSFTLVKGCEPSLLLLAPGNKNTVYSILLSLVIGDFIKFSFGDYTTNFGE